MVNFKVGAIYANVCRTPHVRFFAAGFAHNEWGCQVVTGTIIGLEQNTGNHL
jgi:hypothetical protein